ncbi:MAG: DUF1802 family protein [Paludisphaera borealis]|uniref:DUF1802 family protein n=1 Tax=Paludisphaera borealis TaxID=1387353 RepID=UPI002851A261|nr:DUF1802 family protein [Paludisphaera borealis]MDR3619009.1 DUF1802 family protein [Paludisphaera borealis]
MSEIDLPKSCGVGFKEWSGVCDALAAGAQTVILRKGGIAEGPGGFTPEHPFFWLYPTHVHEAQQGLRTGDERPAPGGDPGEVAIRALAAVDSVRRIDREDDLDALEEFHVWTSETVHKRFQYRNPGLWALVVRVWARERPTSLIATPEQLGCKTWVELIPPLPTAGLAPVLDDEAWERRREALRAVLG